MGLFFQNNPILPESLFETQTNPIKTNIVSEQSNPIKKDSLQSMVNHSLESNESTYNLYNIEESNKNFPFRNIFSGIGFASGVGYAFYKSTGFWKGWGIAIIGSIALGGIGYGIDTFNNKKTK
jgi:hypothetical protein